MLNFSDEDDVQHQSQADTSFGTNASSLLSRISKRSSFIGGNHKFCCNIQLLEDGKVVSYWMDLTKPLSKQFKYNEVTLRFRVRFYPQNPENLREEITRYYLFVQLKRDLLVGRLHCSQVDASLLAGLILQAQLGDYNAKTMGTDSDYVSQYRLLLKQSHKIEEKIFISHQLSQNLTTSEAEFQFLKVAAKLETSEVDKIDYIGKQLKIVPSHQYFGDRIRDSSSDEWKITENNFNLLNTTFHNDVKFFFFFICFQENVKKLYLKFVCPNSTFAKHLWRHLLAQQVFYSETKAELVKFKFSKPRLPLLFRGSTFRYPTSRVLREIVEDNLTTPPKSEGEKVIFERNPLVKYQPRSLDEPWNTRIKYKTNNNEISTISTLDPSTMQSNSSSINYLDSSTLSTFTPNGQLNSCKNNNITPVQNSYISPMFNQSFELKSNLRDLFLTPKTTFNGMKLKSRMLDINVKEDNLEKFPLDTTENWPEQQKLIEKSRSIKKSIGLSNLNCQNTDFISNPSQTTAQYLQGQSKRIADINSLGFMFAGMGIFIGTFVLIGVIMARYNWIGYSL